MTRCFKAEIEDALVIVGFTPIQADAITVEHVAPMCATEQWSFLLDIYQGSITPITDRGTIMLITSRGW
jgi:hypothetical protein